ncbi:MAG TPA: HutD family protein [Reyranella sp.]|nr:HutD family protein [Reyranella sp.]
MITAIDPAQYRRTPWKNGGGTTVDIAEQHGVWRFGRTPITAPGPFSDYAGYDRLQVVVAGRGLVLQTPDGEIDVRTPFKPVRFAGETPIVSRLESGPVEVINLIGDRTKVWLDLQVLHAGASLARSTGTHLAYAADGPVALAIDGRPQQLAADHALRLEASSPTIIGCTSGVLLLGSVLCV